MRHAIHNRFDQLGKALGLAALDCSGCTVAQHEIPSSARHADLRHDPDPSKKVERERLGLLGRLVGHLCLIELFSGVPGEEETLAVVGKLIGFRQTHRRDVRKRGARRQAERLARPIGWMISVGQPSGVLSAMAARRARGWPRGVYFSPGVLLDSGGARLLDLDGAGGLFRVGIVVASELPRRRSTILVRLMAGGRLLPEAIEELKALPKNAHERAVASRSLLSLRRILEGLTDRTTEEEEFIVRTQDIVEELRNEGRNEGQLAASRSALRRILARRMLALSPTEETRIDRCADRATLEHWIDLAVTANSAREALRANRVRGSRRAAPRRARSTA